MSQPFRVAVAGAGYFAQFHLEAWKRLQNEGLVELVGLAEPDASRRDSSDKTYGPGRTFGDVRSMLEALRPDILDIATPPHTHFAMIRLAAEHGTICISQKPLAPTFDEALEMVSFAEKNGTLLVVHENFRWMPWYREMRRVLEQNMLGTPHTISVRMRPGDGQGHDAYLSRQPYFQKMERFLVHETIIHFVDAFRFLFGEISSVTARLRKMNPVIAGEDAGYIVLDFESGVTALIDANRSNDHAAGNTRLTMGEHWLEGSAGVMRLSGDGDMFWKPHLQAEREHAYAWNDRSFAGDCVYEQQKHIVQALASKLQPVNTGRDYLTNYAIEEAIYRSDREDRTIELQKYG